MRRLWTAALLFLLPFASVAGMNYLHGFDDTTCARWEFNTDIVAYDAPGYKAAAAKVQELRTQDAEWAVFQALNHKTHAAPVFGICRYVPNASTDVTPRKFECLNFGNFPLSGASYALIRDRGIFSSSYRCAGSCRSTVRVVHDQTSEDRGNVELGVAAKAFGKRCAKSSEQAR